MESVLTRAPGNDAPIGGLKVVAASGWFVARPSGTEEIYKIYAESFQGPDHLHRIIEEAQAIVDEALSQAAVAKPEKDHPLGNHQQMTVAEAVWRNEGDPN